MQGRARRRYYNRDLRLQCRDFVLQLDRLEEVRPALDQGADHVALVRRQLASPDRCEDVAECFGAFAWIGQWSCLEIDRDTLAHRHGPIDEEGQRRGVLLLRAGLEQGGEDVGQFFGELAIETLARLSV